MKNEPINLYRNKCEMICTQYSSKMYKFIDLNKNLNNILFKHHYYNKINLLKDL